MQGLDHGLEFADGLSRHIPRLERKKSDGVITPIVAQTSLHELTVVDERVNRHKFDRGHSQAG